MNERTRDRIDRGILVGVVLLGGTLFYRFGIGSDRYDDPSESRNSNRQNVDESSCKTIYFEPTELPEGFFLEDLKSGERPWVKICGKLIGIKDLKETSK